MKDNTEKLPSCPVLSLCRDVVLHATDDAQDALGFVDTVYAKELPLKLPPCVLLVRIQNADPEHKMTIDIVPPGLDREPLVRIPIQIPEDSIDECGSSAVQISFKKLEIPEVGTHNIVLKYEDNVMNEFKLFVVKEGDQNE